MLPWRPPWDLSWGVSRVPSLRVHSDGQPSSPAGETPSAKCPSRPQSSALSLPLRSAPHSLVRIGFCLPPGLGVGSGTPASSHTSPCPRAAAPGDPRGGRPTRSPTGLSARSPRRAGGHPAPPPTGQAPGGEHSRAAGAHPQGRRAWGRGGARGIRESRQDSGTMRNTEKKEEKVGSRRTGSRNAAHQSRGRRQAAA